MNTLTKLEGFTVVERAEGSLGYVSVVESVEKRIRILRCDHSILGGEWISAAPSIVVDPIYAVFVMLEAVRLVAIEGQKPKNDSQARTLVMYIE